ncbi:mitochondrial outer membrane protein [Malassezia pachydermatis]
MAQLQQPLVDLHDIPILRLAAIRITGLKDTRNGFLAGMCRPYVDPTAPEAFLSDLRYGHRMYFPLPGQPTTIHAILQSATSFSADISRMDLAKDISVELEPSTVSDRHPHEDVDVVLRIRPASRFFLKTSTSVGNSEGTASVQGKIRNLFGGAESLEGSATLGTRTKHNYNVAFATPVLSCPDLWANVSAMSQHRDLTGYLSAHEAQHVLRSALMYAHLNGTRHELAYEASHRHFHHILPEASVALRRLAKPSIKSAITYTMERDLRDPSSANLVGSYFKTVLEYAGLGGDTSFMKMETQASVSDMLSEGWSWSLGFRTGIMKTLDNRAPCLSDRFMLGGPTCVRMFRMNTLGPKQKHESLGGDAYWAAGASLLAPIPTRSHWPLRLHTFLNTGQLMQMQPHQPLGLRTFSELMQPSASAGVGVLFQQGPVRLELNFGLPLLARVGDGARKGIQFGIGLDFL